MLTIREALQLPVFASANLAAGRAGLDNQINWVHIVDIPDARYEWHRRGVLLLTAGFGLRDHPERQQALIPKLVAEGFAGMVLSVGYYFDHVPPLLREAADALAFPIIEAPRDLLFIEVTEAILERIVNRQYVLLQQSNDIYARLTRLVLQGANLNSLAGTLAAVLERSVTIEDTSFRVLGAAQQGLVDEARREALANGRTSPDTAQKLLDAGIYDRLLQKMGPIHVPPMPESDMMLERYVAPIIVDREIYGYIWIIAGERPLTPLDELTISHGATVAALMMFKDEAVRKAEEALRGDFFEQLLQPGERNAQFFEQARRLNYRLDKPHQVVLIHGLARAGGNGRFLLNNVEKWLKAQAIPMLLVWHDENMVVVLESHKPAIGRDLAGTIAVELKHPAHKLLLGVSERCEEVIHSSYAEAREAIHIAQLIGQDEGVVAFGELGVWHWLYHLSPEKRVSNTFIQHIHTLAAYDDKRRTELVKTLETYLDHGGSLVEAAQVLYIHRNTLLHRLERIETLCHVNLRQPLDRLNLHVAVKGYRLFGQET
jgi:purine catabolism regulator